MKKSDISKMKLVSPNNLDTAILHTETVPIGGLNAANFIQYARERLERALGFPLPPMIAGSEYHDRNGCGSGSLYTFIDKPGAEVALEVTFEEPYVDLGYLRWVSFGIRRKVIEGTERPEPGIGNLVLFDPLEDPESLRDSFRNPNSIVPELIAGIDGLVTREFDRGQSDDKTRFVLLGPPEAYVELRRELGGPDVYSSSDFISLRHKPAEIPPNLRPGELPTKGFQQFLESVPPTSRSSVVRLYDAMITFQQFPDLSALPFREAVDRLIDMIVGQYVRAKNYFPIKPE